MPKTQALHDVANLGTQKQAETLAKSSATRPMAGAAIQA